ncbi:MAG: 16S rRNA (adenine(1518)-N(6)/adenine(1519)-N(6))-dimethyltransferase RsmA [Ruminococcaceae bacterium]|nr:16S rRNA (adenine(1518)-N(6)/adenine(1519)-N(6))-dimethyltransferase RsmA [Oscillospiraceae bacterium]
MILTNAGELRELLGRHGFTFSKGLGQNFLINPSVCPRMAENSITTPSMGVLEVGPGVGVLTVELAKRAAKVVCIELDERLFPILDETLADFDNTTVIHGDVLETDIAAVIKEHFTGMDVAVCANLPYYITSPVIMKLLEEDLPITSLTVMVQKEAAKRICAAPGTREAGAISIAVRYYSEPKILFDVSRGSFMPPPNVDSCVIKLDIRQTPAVDCNRKNFFRVIRACFSLRRKTVLNCLSSGLSISKNEAALLLDTAGIPQNARAEQLSMENFAAIARQL